MVHGDFETELDAVGDTVQTALPPMFMAIDALLKGR